VTKADLAIATASTAAGAGPLTAAYVWYTSASGSTRTTGVFFEELVDVEDATPDFTLNDVVLTRKRLWFFQAQVQSVLVKSLPNGG